MDRETRLLMAGEDEFDVIYDALERNFIPEERRDREDARRLVAEGAYTVYNILCREEKVGFITVWELDDGAFVEHFVVYERFRGEGYGGDALKALKSRYKRLVLEVELPTEGIPARRMAFYERCGFVRNRQYYFQPAYRKGSDGVELVLMSYPNALDDFHRTAREIYKKVYGEEYRC